MLFCLTQFRLENLAFNLIFLVILQTDLTESAAISINWLSLLSRVRKQRAESDKQLYEERRKAFLAQNNTEPSDHMNE